VDEKKHWDELSKICGRLSAGSFGCSNDFIEAWITAQRIPARIETQIAVGWAARNFSHNF
jgi:hypothetical protein